MEHESYEKTFQESSVKMIDAGTALADAILGYFDLHPKGSVSFVDAITGSDGRQVEFGQNLIDFKPRAV